MKKYESEWCLLQSEFESYEKHSLYIKLMSVLILFLSEAFNVDTSAILFLLLVLWIQDSIWKTFQSRLEPRLLKIEKNIREDNQSYDFQFNHEYQAAEKSGVSKILEYVRQSIRPTIAFPHVVLIMIVVSRYFCG